MAHPTEGDSPDWDSHATITLGRAAGRRAAALAEQAPLLHSEVDIPEGTEDESFNERSENQARRPPEGKVVSPMHYGCCCKENVD